MTRPQRPVPTPLSELADWTRRTLVPARLEQHGPGAGSGAGVHPDPQVSGVSLSTERICAGDLYAALPGARAHGADFADRAVAAGAVAVLTDEAGLAKVPPGVPVLVVDRPRAMLGRLSAHLYGDPATHLRMIGVTGTQGKTTTTRLLEGGLAGCGHLAAVIGTVGTRVAGEDISTSLTTPEAPDLHGLLALMRERGVEACAMEVSSHALSLGRVDGVVFDVAVFLNLGRDHLDFHGDVESYYAAKASLFTPERARRALVNVDDEHGRRLAAETTIPVTTFSTTGRDADWQAVDLRPDVSGTSFTVLAPDGTRIAARATLPGAFNVSNALAALAAGGEAGFDAGSLAHGLGETRVPGRVEVVSSPDDPFEVVVDYAHKPDAVEAAITALRAVAPGRVIVVLGAGGDRDQGKRPIMGEIAARLADVLVVTDDNPRTEDPATIRAAMLAGAAEGSRGGSAEVLEVGERRAAIHDAVRRARPGDVVLVAGKGHETGQEIDGVVHPFDDREVAREALRAVREQPRGRP